MLASLPNGLCSDSIQLSWCSLGIFTPGNLYELYTGLSGPFLCLISHFTKLKYEFGLLHEVVNASRKEILT